MLKLTRLLVTLPMWIAVIFAPIYCGIIFSWGIGSILFLLIVGIAHVGGLTALMKE